MTGTKNPLDALADISVVALTVLATVFWQYAIYWFAIYCMAEYGIASPIVLYASGVVGAFAQVGAWSLIFGEKQT